MATTKAREIVDALGKGDREGVDTLERIVIAIGTPGTTPTEKRY
jgi:hypothetical protein